MERAMLADIEKYINDFYVDSYMLGRTAVLSGDTARYQSSESWTSQSMLVKSARSMSVQTVQSMPTKPQAPMPMAAFAPKGSPKRKGILQRHKRRKEEKKLRKLQGKGLSGAPDKGAILYGAPAASFFENEMAPALPQESLADRLSKLDESFAQTVLRLIDEHGMTDVEVYKRANMSRQLFSKIRKDDDYRPTKKTACALAFALGLDHEDALALLSRAGFTLSHSSKFDVIVEYFLVNGIHDVFLVNEALFAYDQPILG